MPYRRLPTTDLARLRAMHKALKISGDRTTNYVILPHTVAKLEEFSHKFEQVLKQYNMDKKNRNQRAQELKILEAKARLYISHFIQVLQLSIEREEIKPEALFYYGLDEYAGKVPSLAGDKEVLNWGEKIINGEQRRAVSGGNPIYNPSIALVKVIYNEYREVYINFENYKETFSKTSEKIIKMRKQCNQLIASVWDEVEKKFEELSPKHKRQKAEDYGVVYIFRRKEKKKLTASDLQGDLLFE